MSEETKAKLVKFGKATALFLGGAVIGLAAFVGISFLVKSKGGAADSADSGSDGSE